MHFEPPRDPGGTAGDRDLVAAAELDALGTKEFGASLLRTAQVPPV